MNVSFSAQAMIRPMTAPQTPAAQARPAVKFSADKAPRYEGAQKALLIASFAFVLAKGAGKRALNIVSGGRLCKDAKPVSDYFKLY